jgi:antitoxin component YwqK of YwqJK toxin-antitoxin module
MKKYMIMSALILSGVIFAQEIEPKYEIEGSLIKATSFYENGQIKQVGFYKNGKVQGKWVSYTEIGEKLAQGEYNDGVKTGKWFFWSQNTLNEVDYSNNRIAEVKKWSKESLVQRN